ncbi:YafY family protein [Accumulibacter sp.]|uniref:helix-turn-helix transcriptional regulator n=1 Tax=Accumulibacter sp. TaxID=2053492 RepID=UPI0025E51329|nr:YafY family protein [Accumulibacter sp.]MCM8594078.1 YafY family transcriptional regulator [Accumulibacter sp.]MCM8624486.1 YafY family transcriptional regulator [Accumulibacter sp.]MDS4048222.1 YafY family protein [Accumulibacter sp.]
MSGMERIYQIDQMLGNRPFVSRAELQERLGISWATLKRDLAYMKDRLNAPITYDRHLGGYRFEKAGPRVGPQYELPGLWFSAEEIHALLTMQHLISSLDSGGLLGPQIRPLLARLTGLLGSADNPAEEVQRRIRIQTVGAREFHLDHFQAVGSALLRRKRLIIRYHARGTDEVTDREVSPQRLNHYRDNWYLDAWCHLRDGLRAFSVDAIESVEILDKRAKDVSDRRLDEVLGAGYGIFSGDQVTWAVLRFTPERARWVAAERWHPKQKRKTLPDGGCELRVPYADDRELIMDIMKYGSECTVVEPDALRQRVADEMAAALTHYRETPPGR